MTSARPTLPRQVGRWAAALVFAGLGVVAGWLLISGVLALPLAEGVLFGIGAVVAAAFLGGAVMFRRLTIRAFTVGGVVGASGSLLLVMLLVVG